MPLKGKNKKGDYFPIAREVGRVGSISDKTHEKRKRRSCASDQTPTRGGFEPRKC